MSASAEDECIEWWWKSGRSCGAADALSKRSSGIRPRAQRLRGQSWAFPRQNPPPESLWCPQEWLGTTGCDIKGIFSVKTRAHMHSFAKCSHACLRVCHVCRTGEQPPPGKSQLEHRVKELRAKTKTDPPQTDPVTQINRELYLSPN